MAVDLYCPVRNVPMNIHPMTSAHLERAQVLTASFNWPHTPDDWAFAFRLGSGHVVQDGDQLLGTCLTWPLGKKVSSLGLLTVAQAAQGQGLGRALLRHALAQAKDRTILLHATAAAIKLYRSEAFSPLAEVRQFQAIVQPPNHAPANTLGSDTGQGVALLRAAQRDQLLAVDRDATGVDRAAILDALLPLSVVRIIGAPGALEGYAITRRFGRGYVIGPVVAVSESAARTLVEDALRAHAGDFVRIDITDKFVSTGWLESWGLREVDQVLAMSNGPLPEASGTGHRFALAGHAFG